MPGKMTRPDDGRRNNRGTIGNKGNRSTNRGSRPKGSVSERGQRGIHQIRAYDDEWVVIKDFMKLTRINVEKCRIAVEMLKSEIE